MYAQKIFTDHVEGKSKFHKLFFQAPAVCCVVAAERSSELFV